MLNSKNTVLVIIDVQGNLARIMQNTDVLLQNLAILIQGARLPTAARWWRSNVARRYRSCSGKNTR